MGYSRGREPTKPPATQTKQKPLTKGIGTGSTRDRNPPPQYSVRMILTIHTVMLLLKVEIRPRIPKGLGTGLETKRSC